MPVIEVSTFPVSEIYKAEPDIITEALKKIGSYEGALGTYHGLQVQNNGTGYVINVWSSFEALKPLQSHGSIISKITAGPIESWHAQTIYDPFQALEGPLTEVVVLSMITPSPENKDAFGALFDLLGKLHCGKSTYGWTVENNDEVLALAAWDSLEAHQARAQQPDVVEYVKVLLELVHPNGGPFHVKLTKI